MNSSISTFKLLGTTALVLELFFSTHGNNSLAAIRSPSRPYVVVLDPGHGGKDTGAKGKLKGKPTTLEKDITLGLAIRTSRVLQDPKYWRPLGRPIKVVLTRDKDIDVSLQERTKIAQKAQADLFLSIHSNSEKTGTVSGIETFFLRNDRSSAEKLAKYHKNESELVLRAIASDSTVRIAQDAAELIHKSTLDYLENQDLPQSNRGVKNSLLYVLLDTKVPAVLFEGLYLSNPHDLQFLQDGENRQKMAEGLAAGVLRFLATL
jgi:N-acetylmuramoyl-L-alanine amidase